MVEVLLMMYSQYWRICGFKSAKLYYLHRNFSAKKVASEERMFDAIDI